MAVLSSLDIPSLPVGPLAVFLVGTVAVYRLVLVVYRVFFHPLSKFPGPKLYAATYFPYLYQNAIRGTFAKDLLKLHVKYGPIVRVTPDRLFLEGTVGYPEAFARRPDEEEYAKIPETYGYAKPIGIMIAERDDHRRQRRLLSHAFSEAALAGQEAYIQYYVNLLMARLKERAETGAPVDMVRWYNFTTFDIIGELAFADPFDSLENSKYHPWVKSVYSTVKSSRQMLFFAHYNYLKPLLMTRAMKQNAKNRDDTRKDIMSYVLRYNGNDEKGMTHEELMANARSLIVAGSETTASAMSAFTFHLLQNPRVYKMLVDEIRTSFSSDDEINMKSTAGLPYLNACIEETLRIYPPATTTIVAITNWATHHNPRNFRDPETFAPARWLPAAHPLYDPRYASDDHTGFRPFSYGPRDCIGKNLANAEMRLILARLLWNLDLALFEGQEDWVARQRVFDVYEKGPLMVQLRRRYVAWGSRGESTIQHCHHVAFLPSYPERTPRDIAGQSFDYVIVGGGTAGCAVASRLSEDPNVRVLVLERGRVRDHWLSRIPLLSGSLLGGASLFQMVQRLSEPTEQPGASEPDSGDDCDGDGAAAAKHQRADLRTAEALGMLWTRGAPGMYNAWADELGHPDWSWDKVEPFFRKIEHAAAESFGRRTYLGRDGPVHLRKHEPQFEIYDHVDKAAAALGLPIDNDVNDPGAPPSGYFYLDSTIDRDGSRHSAYSAYLPKSLVLERRNRLTVCTGVVASKLEVDASQHCVRGVHVRSVGSNGGDSTFIKAEREVIVCSGAICSPQLLMLSGIGSAEQLEPLGIPVHKDLPGVGSHLSDHHGLPIMMKVPLAQTLHRLQSNILFAIWQVILWIWNKTGILKSGTTATTIYVNTSHIDPQTSTIRAEPDFGHDTTNAALPENVPDVEIMVIPAGTVLGRFQGIPLCSFYTCLVQPQTTGRLELASGTDPEQSPRIHYRALSDGHDCAVARKALRFALHLAEQFAHKSGYRHAAELFFAPGVQAGRRDISKWRDLDDDALDTFARGAVQSVLHLGCTCRMAPEGDGGVVDDRLRVHGFRGLRVADASVFPRIPTAHTMAATYMVAERCAEFVKTDWKHKTS
ncbi:hypothetical protein PG994_006512 [Apiospora phragmitis]|uniref:Glucose-methanol-choline oxidoreductase N-terminal domain-containing protein n=1 Tax=Apiospora phragmitis TaxID=2905665 RepID=A0ABR1VF92_9PEZI